MQEQKQQTAQTAARASEDALQTAQADGRTAAAVQADRSLNLNLTIHVENVRISKELDAALQAGSCPAEIVQADRIRVEAEALGPQTEAPEPRVAADVDKPGAADETIAEMRGGAAAAGQILGVLLLNILLALVAVVSLGDEPLGHLGVNR